ncbi:PhoX family protein [Pararhodospirillum oryzae]|uniref:dTDP-glucose 4,6-dehydratase n=1 Tax=Pararhodospirillum oryzae TaxID=478448 RepID=A0A512H643_9PROT|nr:PhoX family phosphatase [Pararhodospirillum oryzae]GEO80917.1 dTDP-glucose 4,6-dehydratase [Pararhodospirillum oryzae]
MTQNPPEGLSPAVGAPGEADYSNPSVTTTLGDLIAARLGGLAQAPVGRRDALRGLGALSALAALPAAATGLVGAASKAHAAGSASPSTLTFAEIPHILDATTHVAEGYNAQVLIRWGDPVLPGAPAFDPNALKAADQLKQFGYNNDFLGYFPLERGSNTSTHGLLTINHEYVDRKLMWSGQDPDAIDTQTKEQIDYEMAAHGHSVIEVKKDGDTWSVVPDSRYARRFSALETEFTLSGPAAGHKRLRTSADPTGTKVIGTVNNCAGGVTPWGTVLIAEENFDRYFMGESLPAAEEQNYKRLGIKKPDYGWYRFHPRFDTAREPNEANRFGWMIEIDPYDPTSTPIKRTALGRFKHEGANVIVNHDGRLAVYAGDDERFEFLYKFLTKNKVDLANPANNKHLLDEGTLYVARFKDDGTMAWLPLVHGHGPLTAANGFNSQADVLIETRRAATLLGATPMDRPEDVEPNPVTGSIFVVLTNNTKRKPDQVDAANPRPANEHGHILEIIPPGGKGAQARHEAETATWMIFLLAGNPAKPEDGARYHPATTEAGWLSCPDNIAFDPKGRIWIATDGATKAGIADGIWASDVEGDGRALTRHFFATPTGAEMCGPFLTPDGTTFFCCVQHPGDDKDSTFDKPSTRWPDFKDGMPPRPSVVAITRKGGGEIGQ